jgi:hypothetical protein
VCAQCDALGAPRARVGGEDTPFDDVTSRDCCSATCAVALLDSMYKGVARIEGKKRSGVIALKRAGQRTGLWPRGRKQLGVEKRKAARVRDVDGNLTDEAIELLNRAAVEAPHEMYPLSQLAADMGRARLLMVKTPEGVEATGLASRERKRRWQVYVTEEGWPFVTDRDAAHEWRKRNALKRLGGNVYR